MKINLYLDKVQKSGLAPIFLFASFNGKRLKLTTGELIAPALWDEDKQRVKRSASGSAELNRRLEILSDEIKRIYRDQRDVQKIVPTPASIKQALRDEGPSEPAVPDYSFIERFEDFVTNSKTTKKTSVISVYNTTLKHLRDYQAHSRESLSFEFVNAAFYEKFVKYLITELKLNNNTVGKYIKTLKTFLHYSVDRGWYSDRSFARKFKVFKEEVDTVSLTKDELAEIEKLDLSKNPRLDKVRDMFLLQCYTGLRYSDIANLKPENIKADHLRLQTAKTKEVLFIPLIPKAQEIMKKYPDGKLYVITNQRMNSALKELAKAAEINESTVIVSYQGAKREEGVFPKHDLITTHTGRRTFVTLSLEMGMRPESVMKITGHKDLKSFKKYIKITEKVTEQEMLRAWG